MRIEERIIYIAEDNTELTNEYACREYEQVYSYYKRICHVLKIREKCQLTQYELEKFNTGKAYFQFTKRDYQFAYEILNELIDCYIPKTLCEKYDANNRHNTILNERLRNEYPLVYKICYMFRSMDSENRLWSQYCYITSRKGEWINLASGDQ